ncbi:ABC transporter permease [Lichenicola cladoniae]|uniref:ABC transporter permease n=1 Tax=Lichenicola cladoniae TaxID=1484109 RepID=A0A6M8HPH9_9PROT|nr:ABC transporter permease [Lichenicola cladoniae]NPD66380.1 ABC transporter permease [Acetobacteraceae bacterium]QKE90379.1 ABC transporter permease [Lichenicola cladoniae]
MTAVNGSVEPGPVLDLSPETAGARLRHALQDLRESAGLWRLCLTLGWLDVKLRYRGSLLGPFWLTASTAVMIAAMSLLYTTLFHIDIKNYMPFLSLSLVLWGFIGSVVNEGTTCFTSAEGMIRSMRLPFGLHAARVLVRNILVLLHNVIVIVVVFAIFRVWPGAHAFWALPAAGLWLLDAIAACLLLGTLGARYRDIPPIIGSLMQIFFFISPIIWKPELITHGHALLQLNPFYALIEIVRRPLLGEDASQHLWNLAIGDSVALWIGAILLFMRVRARLAYWL